MSEKEPQKEIRYSPSKVTLRCSDCKYMSGWSGPFWEVSDAIVWLSNLGMVHLKETGHRISVTTDIKIHDVP